MTKLTFSKRCPYCKSKSFDRANRKAWMRIIPKTKYYTCNKCYRSFIALFGISDIFEKRKHRHYKTLDNVLVKLSPAVSEAFQVVDISRGGLSFCYTTGKEPPAVTNELEIMYSAKSIRSKIPSMLILDHESENRLSESNRRTRIFGGRFTNLTRKHNILLLNNLPKLTKPSMTNYQISSMSQC